MRKSHPAARLSASSKLVVSTGTACRRAHATIPRWCAVGRQSAMRSQNFLCSSPVCPPDRSSSTSKNSVSAVPFGMRVKPGEQSCAIRTRSASQEFRLWGSPWRLTPLPTSRATSSRCFLSSVVRILVLANGAHSIIVYASRLTLKRKGIGGQPSLIPAVRKCDRSGSVLRKIGFRRDADVLPEGVREVALVGENRPRRNVRFCGAGRGQENLRALDPPSDHVPMARDAPTPPRNLHGGGVARSQRQVAAPART